VEKTTALTIKKHLWSMQHKEDLLSCCRWWESFIYCANI